MAFLKDRLIAKLDEQIANTGSTPNGQHFSISPGAGQYMLQGYSPAQLKAFKEFIKSFPE